MSYLDEVFRPHLRLTILRVLADAPECRTNDAVLAEVARGLGLPATRDKVRTELAWLEEQGLAVTAVPAPALIVATATERGLDAAAGRATVPGVQKPTPR